MKLIAAACLLWAIWANALTSAETPDPTLKFDEEVMAFRGDGTGRFPDAQPPTRWSPTENILWKTPLPPSNSSPIIVGERIFVAGEPDKLFCLDLRDGRILWERSNPFDELLTPERKAQMAQAKKKEQAVREKLGPLYKEQEKLAKQLESDPNNPDLAQAKLNIDSQVSPLERELNDLAQPVGPRTDPTTGYSTPTPVSDGRHVWAHFGTGVVACYDLAGRRQWIRIVDDARNSQGHAASPRLADGVLVVHLSDVVGLDPARGAELWRTKSVPHWGTPGVAQAGAEPLIVTTNAEFIRARDGVKISDKIFEELFSSPVVQAGKVYFVARHGGIAFEVPASAQSKIKPKVLTRLEPRKIRCFSSPIIQDGLAYTISETQELSVIDLATGRDVYRRKLEMPKGIPFSSLTAAGDYIYACNDDGACVIFAPGREYKEVARNQLEPIRSCPVFFRTRMYFRGLRHLYCVGK